MAKKIGIVAAIILVIGARVIAFMMYNNNVNARFEAYEEALIEKDEEIAMWMEVLEEFEHYEDAYGPTLTVFRVITDKKAGIEFRRSDVEPMEIPASFLADNDEFVTDLSILDGTIYKVDVRIGMPITRGLFFREILMQTDRFYDVVADLFPIGAEKGDYFDLRIVTPNGLDYIVLSKKRVIEFYGEVVRFILSEEEIHQYHSAFGSQVLSNYLGVEFVEDVTRSLSHVTKLLKNDMIRPEEISDYAVKVFDGLDLYSTSKLSLDMGELLEFYDFLLTKMTVYNHIVIDVDAGITSDFSKLAVSISDILIIPVTHNQTVINATKEFTAKISKTMKDMRRRKELKIIYVLNHYQPNIGTYKGVAAKLGIRPQRLLTIHENPEIIKACNSGKISDVLANALTGKSKGSMLNFRSDMKTLCQAIIGKDFLWNVGKEGKN
jgi:hypothetical protein